MRRPATTWQTVGPYFRIGLEPLYQADIAGEGANGERIRVDVRILDGDAQPIPDAVIEVWQANSAGKYAHPDDRQDKRLEAGFRGFGRIPTDENGVVRFTTIRPGPVPGPGTSMQAPHLLVNVMMRGLLRNLITRAYFPGDEHNAADPILTLVPPSRRSTLLLTPSPQDTSLFLWIIRMQGESETIFFNF